MTTAAEAIARLQLQPHPEGGYYRETYRSPLAVTHPETNTVRAAVTAIYFLLEAPDFSAFHRVRSDETWHFYDGDPVELHLIDPAGQHELRELTRTNPQTTVPANCWQAARLAANRGWLLAGCTVAPGFDFADFEMPSASELTQIFPQHARLITTLARRNP